MPRQIIEPKNVDTISDLVRYMVAKSGKSGVQVSTEMGRTSNYISAMLKNGTMPSLELFVAIAQACGYSLELHDRNGIERWGLSVGDGGQLQISLDAVTLSYSGFDVEMTLDGKGNPEGELDGLKQDDLKRLIRQTLAEMLAEPEE